MNYVNFIGKLELDEILSKGLTIEEKYGNEDSMNRLINIIESDDYIAKLNNAKHMIQGEIKGLRRVISNTGNKLISESQVKYSEDKLFRVNNTMILLEEKSILLEYNK